MIKINLLSDPKTKRRAGGGPRVGPRGRGVGGGGGGSGWMLVGLLVIAAFAGGVYVFVHRELANDIQAKNDAAEELKKQNKDLKKQTEGFREMKEAFEAAESRQKSIERLKEARAVPAWMLWELSNILTRGRSPQLTEQAKTEIKNNPNRPWQDGWDAKHVWVSSFVETGGKFTLSGGAQSKGDVTELALRMQSSMFFDNVQPKESDDVTDKESGITYHKFKIVGTVRY